MKLKTIFGLGILFILVGAIGAYSAMFEEEEEDMDLPTYNESEGTCGDGSCDNELGEYPHTCPLDCMSNPDTTIALQPTLLTPECLRDDINNKWHCDYGVYIEKSGIIEYKERDKHCPYNQNLEQCKIRFIQEIINEFTAQLPEPYMEERMAEMPEI